MTGGVSERLGCAFCSNANLISFLYHVGRGFSRSPKFLFFRLRAVWKSALVNYNTFFAFHYTQLVRT